MRISVLGCGRWGSFLAWYANRVGRECLLWGRKESRRLASLRDQRMNEYLKLPDEILLSDSLEEALEFGDIVVISISSQSLRALGGEIGRIAGGRKDKIYVLCMKGLERGSGKRLSEVLTEEIGGDKSVAVWVGPGHVQDFTRGIPNCMVVASKDKEVTKKVVDVFGGNLIRFYYGEDLLGIEIGAAAKNVIGIAAGMLDGLDCASLKGALMARGARELSRLVKAMGGEAATVYGLSHLGDYEATLFSPHSNNRRFGEGFVRGERFDKLAEGVSAAEAMTRLSETYRVEMPICRAVQKIVIGSQDPKKILLDLFMRPVKSE